MSVVRLNKQLADQPVANMQIDAAKSWLSQEIFWTGVWSSIVAGLIVWALVERK